jgi:FKBP-type peptidyl-prolyl cis-trans isomerase
MKFKNYILILNLTIFSLYSCHTSTVEPVKKETVNREEENIIAFNKYLIEKDNILIDEYAKRNHLNLIKTETGLRYQIISKGKGIKIKPQTWVSLSYRLYLLDGTLCYSSDSIGKKEFTVGVGKVENGLDEGLTCLHQGDSAILILPPHLAYGLIGDGKCIPSRATIIYKIKVDKAVASKKHV